MNFKILWNFNNNEINRLKEGVTKKSINDAFKKRSTEIDSLKKYDRGEKKITPRSLKSTLSGI